MQGCDLQFHVDGQSSRMEDKRERRLVIEDTGRRKQSIIEVYIGVMFTGVMLL